MGKNRIKGITIQIGGDTTGLQESLKGVNSEINRTQAELKDVESLLKLDPTNTDLLRQKQELLAAATEQTSKKLETLNEANRQATESVSRYDEWKEKYAPIQKEIEETRKRLNELKAARDEAEDVDADQYAALQEEISDTGKRLQELRKEARAVSEEFGHPISKEQYNALQREVAATEIELKKLETAADQAADATETLEDAAGHAEDGLKSLSDVVKGGALLDAAEQLEGVGGAIKDAAGNLVELAGEYDNAQKKASAYFGETGEEAQATADLIKNIYAQGVGESMDGISDAVIIVKNNLKDLDSQTLENITKQAITLDEIYGIDMNETLRGVNSIMKNFGLDAQAAMDYLVAGTQRGLDKTNELGDNLAEYAGKFSQAGYSVDEYFQLLNNGLDGGAYNLDKVNDAINEVTTRLSDGTISDAMAIYSDKTEALFDAWQEGEVTQKQVIDSIIEDIKGAESQQDALNMAAKAFGTMAEDGNLQFIESLTSVGTAYEDVGGKAAAMFDQTTTPQQELTAAIREVQMELVPLGQELMELAADVIPPVSNVVKDVIGFLKENPVLANVIIALLSVVGVLTTLAPLVTAVMTAVMALSGVALGPIIGVIAGVVAAVATAITIFQNWDEITQTLGKISEEIWTDIETLFTETVPEALDSLKRAAVDKFDSIKSSVYSFTSNVLTNIRNMMDDVRQNVDEKLTMVRNLWNELKESTLKISRELKEDAVKYFIELKDGAIETFINLKNGAKEKVSDVRDTIMDGINGAVEWIKDLPEEAVNWGSDMIDGFVDGISSGIRDVKNAVGDIAEAIWEKLHFSKPENGPLRDYEMWMPDMMQGLAEGIRDNRNLIREQISEVANDIAFIGSNGGNPNQQIIVKNYNVLTVDGKVVAEVVDEQLGIVL